MTTGSQSDILSRIKALLPPWFGDGPTPVLDGIVTGPATTLSFVYALIQYVKTQARIATETGGFLDLASSDFFGTSLPRQPAETDAAFLTRIKAAFFPSRNTVGAMTAALTALGLTVEIIEPWNPMETSAIGETLYYSRSGYLGSRTLNNQCFLVVTRPEGSSVTNAQIYAAINATKPVAVVPWTAIVG
jgi:hypothetical protein